MYKTTVKIDGMVCAMCEAHVNDAVRKNFAVTSVKADKDKGEAEILSDAAPDAAKLRSVIAETGYTVGEIVTEPYKKKGFLRLFGKN